jgi:hypothetical protein
MTTKLTVLIAAMCLSAGVMAQTQSSGTSNTGTPTAGQSNATSGEQNATGMQNNSNRQNLPQKNKAAQGKADKSGKTKKADCVTAHTDGHATTAATAADSQMAAADCNPAPTTQR